MEHVSIGDGAFACNAAVRAEVANELATTITTLHTRLAAAGLTAADLFDGIEHGIPVLGAYCEATQNGMGAVLDAWGATAPGELAGFVEAELDAIVDDPNAGNPGVEFGATFNILDSARR